MDKLQHTINCNSIIEKLDILLQQLKCGLIPQSGGICWQVDQGGSELFGDSPPSYVYLWYLHSHIAFEAWPQFSGDTEFPVPGTSVSSAEAQYYRSSERWVGPQLELRLSLIRHLIEYFEELGHASEG